MALFQTCDGVCMAAGQPCKGTMNGCGVVRGKAWRGRRKIQVNRRSSGFGAAARCRIKGSILGSMLTGGRGEGCWKG